MSTAKPTVSYRSIPDYPGYCVGDDGSVWCNRGRGGLRGKAENVPWRQLNPVPAKGGYLVITLYQSGRKAQHYVHRLVLLAFVGPCPVGMEACHGNGNRGDNSLLNLRWDTKKANQADRVKHGTDNRGENNQRAKLTAAQVLEIRALWATGNYTFAQLANQFGVLIPAIWSIIQRRTWKHI